MNRKEYYEYYYERQKVYEYIASSKLRDYINLTKSNIDLLCNYYKSILPNEVKLIKELSQDSKRIDLYFALYYYLLWNGYLSYNNNFTGQVDDNEIPTLLGQSISIGKGICRNIAFHFNDILYYLKDNCYVAGVHLNNDESTIKDYFKNEIKRDITWENTNTNSAFLPNHAVNLYKNNNDIYLYDATNFIVKKLSDYRYNNNPNCIDLRINLYDGTFLIDYKSTSNSLKRRKMFLNSITNIMKDYEKRTIHLLSREYHINLLKEAIELCEENNHLLDDYKINMASSYKKIRKCLK